MYKKAQSEIINGMYPGSQIDCVNGNGFWVLGPDIYYFRAWQAYQQDHKDGVVTINYYPAKTS